jgi:hypothetical protein
LKLNEKQKKIFKTILITIGHLFLIYNLILGIDTLLKPLASVSQHEMFLFHLRLFLILICLRYFKLLKIYSLPFLLLMTIFTVRILKQSFSASEEQASEYQMIRVIDGDTFEIDTGESVQ